ncbi:YcxB family protein [Asanoa sp. NPDC049518]|uniref:YcxB family protein n=1 Tax=unclassified Asanoa TaxID=2685164 RepID=UPI00343D69E0
MNLLEPIECRYTLTRNDLVDAMTAQQHGRWRRSWVVVLLGAGLVGVGIGFARSEGGALSAGATVLVAVVCLAAVLLGVGFGLVTRRFLMRWVRLWQVALIMRGNPALAQPVRTVVSDAGISMENATGSAKSAWAQYPLYTETDRCFVFLTSKGLGAMALALPKRALDGDDTARLRAVLDAYCHRRN